MTEIQWLCDILLNHDLPAKVKKRFIARIGEVEATLGQRIVPRGTSLPPNPLAQSPSTQALLEKHAMQDAGEILPVAKPRVIEPKEVTVSVGNGSSIKGPRKF